MIQTELLLFIIGTSITLLSAVYIFIIFVKIPLYEMLCLMLGTLFLGLAYFADTLTIYMTIIGYERDITLSVYRFGYLFQGLSFLTYLYAIVIPNIRYNYKDMFVFTIITIIDISISTINMFSVNYEFTNDGYIRFKFTAIGFGVFVLGVFLFLIFYYIRLYELKAMMNEMNSSMMNTEYFRNFGIVFQVAISGYLVIVIFTELPLPFGLFLFPFSVQALYLVLSLHRNNAFWVVTNTKMETFIITDINSGNTIFSINLINDEPADHLLGVLLTALNLSMKETIQSKILTEIKFSDKTIFVSRGKKIAVFMIITKTSLLIPRLLRIYTKSFEKVLDNNNLVRISNEETIEMFIVFNEFRKYFPI